MAFFDWEESFELGIKELDDNHKRYVHLLNETFVSGSSGNDALKTIIDKLVDYAEYHFAIEEDLMSLQRYPGWSLHRDEHDRFRRVIRQLRDDFQHENKGLFNKMLNFLKDWLFEHIFHEDVDFAKAMRVLPLH